MDGSQNTREPHTRTRRRLARAFLAAALVHAGPALAQPLPGRDTPIFLLGIEGQYGAPQRAAGGVALFMPMEAWHCEDGLCGGRSLEVQASAGAGAWRLGGGPALMAYPLWFDLLLTLTRTSAMPRGASPGATYVGLEGGFAFPVYAVRKRYLSVRPGIGVAHRAWRPSGPERTTFTWSVGVHFLWPKF